MRGLKHFPGFLLPFQMLRSKIVVANVVPLILAFATILRSRWGALYTPPPGSLKGAQFEMV
jgi:hypothetical protein